MASSPEAERLRIALDLSDTGVAIKRQNLRRQHPKSSEEAIDRLLREWLAGRPPDAPGRLRRAPGA